MKKTEPKLSVAMEPSISYGITDDSSILSLINTVRRGLNFSSFLNLTQRSPFNLNEWASFLHLSERTIQRYEKENKTFDTVYSERIVQITLLYNYGIEVFGNDKLFNTWLESPCIALGKSIPKEFLDSSFGIDLLKSELTKIEHGILA